MVVVNVVGTLLCSVFDLQARAEGGDLANAKALDAARSVVAAQHKGQLRDPEGYVLWCLGARIFRKPHGACRRRSICRGRRHSVCKRSRDRLSAVSTAEYFLEDMLHAEQMLGGWREAGCGRVLYIFRIDNLRHRHIQIARSKQRFKPLDVNAMAPSGPFEQILRAGRRPVLLKTAHDVVD